jgi:hypothetical protein
MKGSSDAIKSALKRLGNDNRPSSSQGPNEQAPARGGGPPGSSQLALPRSTEQPAEAEPSTTVPLEKRQPQNAAPTVDAQDHTTKQPIIWSLGVSTAKGVPQNGVPKLEGDPPTLDRRDRGKVLGWPSPRGGSDRLEICQYGPSTGDLAIEGPDRSAGFSDQNGFQVARSVNLR